MPLIRDIQTALTSGEFDPLLFERVDVTFYRSAAQILENCVCLQQGGVRARNGFPTLMRKRNDLSAVSTGGATVTAPQGGTAGNVVDGDEATALVTTGALGTVNPYVIAHCDFGASQAVDVVDVIDIGVSDESAADIVLQGSPDNAAWTTLGTITLGGEVRSRRVAAAPGAALGTYRYWRLARLGGADLGSATITVAEWSFLAEGSTIRTGKTFDFTVDATTEYQFVLTAGNIDVVRTRPAPIARVASVRVPYADADVLAVKAAQSRDLMLFFHPSHPPLRVFRQGGDDEWDFRDQVFRDVTQFPWGDEFVSGGENEKQQMVVSAAAGSTFNLLITGENTDTISVGASDAATAANIETAIEAHSRVTSVTVTVVSTNVFSVEFDGVDGKRPWPIMALVLLTGSFSGPFVQRTQAGKEDTAPLWDANHGYPADGTFYQGRLWLGGFRDRSGAVAGSRSGAFFEFREDDEVVDTSPLLFEADTDEKVAVHAIHAGRHLQVFTSSGEFYVPSEPITPTNVALRQTSRVGTVAGVPTVDVEGATLFVGRNGRALREYLFVDTEQSYQATEISLLASHLVNEPITCAVRRHIDFLNPTLYLIANGGLDPSGSRAPAAAVTINRAQQVTAFSRWSTPGGTFEAFGATQFGDVLAIVDRTIGGTDYSFIEYLDDTAQLDGGARIENPDVDILAGTGVGPYSYTFTAASAAEVAVHVRDQSSGAWSLVAPAEYTVDPGAKTVTLDAAQSSGQVRISKPMTAVTLESQSAHLDGVALRIVVDGNDDGDATPSGSVITLTTTAYFSVEYGFHFTAQIVPTAYRPSTGEGQMLATKARIPHLALSVYRTSSIYAGLYGEALRPVNLGGATTGELEARLVTGTGRQWGIRGVALDAAPHLRRDKAEPMDLRSLVYDLRW